MIAQRLSLWLGLGFVLISLATWGLDLSQLVTHCIYCRNERTVIGLLGILMMVPWRSVFTQYLALVLGFYGASVSSQHIMLIMKHSNFLSPHLPLTTASLFIIIGQVCFIIYLVRRYRRKERGKTSTLRNKEG